MKMQLQINQYQVHTTLTTLITLRRSLGQMSRSASDSHKNIVNSTTAPGPLKGLQPKLIQILRQSGHESFRGQRFKDQGDKNVFSQRLTDSRRLLFSSQLCRRLHK